MAPWQKTLNDMFEDFFSYTFLVVSRIEMLNERQNTSLITGLHDKFPTFKRKKNNNDNSLQFTLPLEDKVFVYI